jgi:uncharacterized protein (DUF427 family)
MTQNLSVRLCFSIQGGNFDENIAMKAVFENEVIAESDKTVKVEGNYYFPAASVQMEFFNESPTRTLCPWKGEAHYYNLKIHGKIFLNAAWYYPKPSWLAGRVKDKIAFDEPIEVIK